MTIELKILGWSVLLGLAHVLIAAALVTQQRGVKWNVSNRDAPFEPLQGMAARADRASRNSLESFPFVVLCVEIAKANTAHTAPVRKIYFWARVAYLPIYLVRIPFLRTCVWAVSLWGLLQVLEGLLQPAPEKNTPPAQ